MLRFFFPAGMLLFVNLFMLNSYASTPLVIDINEGIEEMPFEVGDVDKEVASSFVETIDVPQLKNTSFDLAQIIENISGIQIRKNGGIGNFTSISIRGKSADQVTVYIDGMPINNASGGSVDLSSIPTNQILRIDVYKDSFPVEFSEVANGGVINIITHRSTNNNQATISVDVGSFQTVQTDFNVLLNKKNWQFITAAGYLESKNNFSFNFENNTFLNPNDDEIQKRNNNEIIRSNFFGKVGYQLNSTANIFVQTEYLNKKKNIPTIYNALDAKATLIDKNNNISVGYNNSSFSNPKFSTQLLAKITQKSTTFDDRYSDITLNPTANKQEHNNLEAKFYSKYSDNEYQLIISNTIRHEKLNIIDQIKNNGVRTNVRQVFTSSFGANVYFNQKRFIISPVIRGLLSQDKYDGETETKIGIDSNAKFSKVYRTFSPQLGIRFKITPDLIAKTNASKYYRLPNYVELFGTRGYIGANEELRPEEGVNFDAGFTFSKFFASDNMTKFSWDLALFHSTIDNEIIYTFSARGIGRPSNINKSVITGLENTFLFEFDYDTILTSSTTIQKPMNTSDSENPKLLAGRSFWFQKTRLQTSVKKFTAYIEHVAKSFYYLDNNEDIPAKETSIFNFGFSVKFKKGEVLLTVNNLLNQQNKDFFFQPMSGQSIFVTTKINLI